MSQSNHGCLFAAIRHIVRCSKICGCYEALRGWGLGAVVTAGTQH
jgi:hypothetical protein